MDWDLFRQKKNLAYGFITNVTASTPPAGAIEGTMGTQAIILNKSDINGQLVSMDIIGMGSLDIPFSTFSFSSFTGQAFSLSGNFSLAATVKDNKELPSRASVSQYDDVRKIYSWTWNTYPPLPIDSLYFAINLSAPKLDTATISYWYYELFYIKSKAEAQDYFPDSMKKDNNSIISLLQSINSKVGGNAPQGSIVTPSLNMPGVII
jgi:hypothetical protein